MIHINIIKIYNLKCTEDTELLIYYFLGARVGGDITLIVSLPYAKIILHHMGILHKVLTFYPMWAHATKQGRRRIFKSGPAEGSHRVPKARV